jgi:hypothetical protein
LNLILKTFDYTLRKTEGSEKCETPFLKNDLKESETGFAEKKTWGEMAVRPMTTCRTPPRTVNT